VSTHAEIVSPRLPHGILCREMRESALKGGSSSYAETLSPFFAGFQISMSEFICNNCIDMISDSDEHGFRQFEDRIFFTIRRR
jgi:hypothetical protein